jgi:PST family polysaccharide transporter
LLNFGANLTASSFLWSLAKGSDGLMIGRVYGSAALGLYTRAGALLNRPLEQAMAPLESIFVPTFARLQSQRDRYRRIVFQICDVIGATSFFFSAMLLTLSRPLTIVVLGAKWEAAAPIFAAFTLVALYTPLTSVAGWILASQGRGGDFLLLSAVGSSVTFAGYLIGLRFGPLGVAVSYSASCLVIQLPVAYWITGRTGMITTGELWRQFLGHAPLWLAVATTIYGIRTVAENWTPIAQLAVCVPAAFVVGALLMLVHRPTRRAVSTLIQVLEHWKGASSSVLTA